MEILGPAELPEFARLVLDHAATCSAALRTSHSLKGLAVEAYVHSPAYRDFCKRALVNDESYANEQQQQVCVSLLDGSRVPELGRRRWAADRFGPFELSDTLERHGLLGGFNADRGLWQFYDPSDRRGVQLTMPFDPQPLRDEAFPLQHFLQWAYQPLGLRLLRAGSLGRDGRGLLLAGCTGPIRSALVLAGLNAGLSTAGDDFAIIESGHPEVRAFPVVRLLKQDAAGLAHAGLEPQSLGAIGPNGQGKYEFDVTALGYDRLASSLDIGGIVILREARQQGAAMIPAAPQDAALALTSCAFAPLAGLRDEARFIADIASAVPAYWLDIGDDVNSAAAAIERHLAALH